LVLVDHNRSTEVSWPRYSGATLDDVFLGKSFV